MFLRTSEASGNYSRRPYRMFSAPSAWRVSHPITSSGISDRYLADKIYGFPVGPATMMASVGELGTSPEVNASDFDHDFETCDTVLLRS